MMDIRTTFEKKTELLCKGLYLDEKLLKHYKQQGIEINYGRKGGAGPLGGRYFLFDNNILVNAALWNDPTRTNLVLQEKEGEYFKVYDEKNKNSFCKLKLVNNPQFYNPKDSLSSWCRLFSQYNIPAMYVLGMRRSM
jgi:hypothetical protein